MCTGVIIGPFDMIQDRYLHTSIREDLTRKMVFIGGPRQVGKTTLARLIGQKEYPAYRIFNWDDPAGKKSILSMRFGHGPALIVFDELHKYTKWKNHIKGIFDTKADDLHILVTGSARLDLYRRGGDSLMGRYHYYRLHPFSLAEALGDDTALTMPSVSIDTTLIFQPVAPRANEILHTLLEFGGFPEPFLTKDSHLLRRFHNDRLVRLIKEDIRDLESVRDLSSLQILADLLPEKVGSLFSLNALREDLLVTHKTVALWVDVLERFYYHFRIYPFASTKIKSLRKEPKLYLWDWSQVKDSARRFENLVASHLLKIVHFLYDAQGYRTELHFLRDRAGHEVDFLVTLDKRPWFAVEVKQSDADIHAPLLYFGNKLKIPYLYQVVETSGLDFLKQGVRVISADKFLAGLV